MKVKLKPDKSPHKIIWFITTTSKTQLKYVKLPHKVMWFIFGDKMKSKLVKLQHNKLVLATVVKNEY